MKHIKSLITYAFIMLGLFILMPREDVSCKWYYAFQPEASDVNGISMPEGGYYYFETDDHAGTTYVYHTIGFTISRASGKDTYESQQCISLVLDNTKPNQTQGDGGSWFIIVTGDPQGYMHIKWGINADWLEQNIKSQFPDWGNDIEEKLDNFEDAWVILDGVVETASKENGEYTHHWGGFAGGNSSSGLHTTGCVYVGDNLLSIFQTSNPVREASGEEADHFKESGAHSPSDFFTNDYRSPGGSWTQDRYVNSILLRRKRDPIPEPDPPNDDPTDYYFEWTTWDDKEGQDGSLRSEETPYYVTYNDSRNYNAVGDGDAVAGGGTYHSAFTDGGEIIIPSGEKYINGISVDSYWGKIRVNLGNVKKTWTFGYKFNFDMQWLTPNPDFDANVAEGEGNQKYIVGEIENVIADSETAGKDLTVDVKRWAFFYYMNLVDMYDFTQGTIANDAMDGDTTAYTSNKLHGKNAEPTPNTTGPIYEGDSIYGAESTEERPTYKAKMMLEDGGTLEIDDKTMGTKGSIETTRYKQISSYKPSKRDGDHVTWAEVNTDDLDLGNILYGLPGASPVQGFTDTESLADVINKTFGIYYDATGDYVEDLARMKAVYTRVGIPEKGIKTVTWDGTEDTFAWVKNDTLIFGYGAKECLKENKKPGDENYDARGIPVTTSKTKWSKTNRPPYLETEDVKPEWIEHTDVDVYETSPAFGSSQLVIPANQKNGKYPTSIEDIYTDLEDGMIYNRILVSTSASKLWMGSKLSSVDSSERILNGFEPKDPIIVQTPVISPVSLHEDSGDDGSGQNTTKGNDAEMPKDAVKTQLVDGEVDTGVTQMRLDETYWFKFDLRSHLSTNGYRSADTSGDDANGWKDIGNTKSKYDKYVKAKWVHFPFDVMLYNGNSTGMPVYIKHTDNESDPSYWTEVADWEWTKFYIPTWAREGVYKDGDTIRYKVEAQNVMSVTTTDPEASQISVDTQDNTDLSHSERELNDYGGGDSTPDENLYIATYDIPVQVSGWVYDFQIVGLNNADIYDTERSTEDTVGWNDMWVPLCLTKNSLGNVGSEKKTGYLNRLGGDSRYKDNVAKYVRYTNTGKVTNSWLFENTVALANGSSSQYSSMGILPKGSRFNFSVKTISNLWHKDDSLKIKPTFYYVTKDGTVKKDITVYYNDYSKEDGKLTYIKYGDSTDNSLVRQVSLSDEGFSGSYKDKDIALSAKLPEPELTSGHNDGGKDTTGIKYDPSNKLNGLTDEQKITKFLTKKSDSYTLSNITIPSSLRVFSGDVEELKANLKTNRNSVNMKTLEDLYSAQAGEYIYTDPLFRVSMQTWYGEYYIPSELFVTEKSDAEVKAKAESYDGLKETDEDIWLHGGHIVIHFDIVTVPGSDNTTRPLAYEGGYSGVNQWKNQKQPDKPVPTETDPDPDPKNPRDPHTDSGDVVIVDDSETNDHKYGAKIFVID